MGTLQRLGIIIGYEWRRALAKKKILALILLAVAVQVLPFVLFTRIFPDLTEEARATMWVFGALGGQNLFIQLMAIIIAGGSLAEEYEQGTVDILLSKPVTRLEYLSGKLLGGFSLLVAVEALMVVVGVFLGFSFFGGQRQLEFAPLILGAIAYSSLLFFSLTFMFSELIRNSTLSMLAAIGVFIASQVLYGVLLMLYQFSIAGGQPNELYLEVGKWLPTWSASNLPIFIASELMPMLDNPLISLVTGELGLAALAIALYTSISVLIAGVRLVKSDVTKKTG
ncbi:MAG: ABC transporter permease subunit [Desulfobacterales bacterium]|nr:ABC transporter permease subunit [Desulfobacterales bacterium]